jgi:hypothetical protein
MPCPNCGGSERVPLAPGYWECMTMITKERIGHPAGYSNPIPLPHQEPCGAHYQEEPPGKVSESCACGVFAIGRCQTCERPVCGRHSDLVGGKLLCSGCIQERAEKARKCKEATEADAARARAREHEESIGRAHEAAVAAAERLSADDSHRIVRVNQRSVARVSAGGSYGISWNELAEEIGKGWHVLNWREYHYNAETGGDWHEIAFALAADGRIFRGASFVKLGRRLRWTRAPVLAIVEELDLTELGTRALQQLATDLLEVASGNPPPVTVELKLHGSTGSIIEDLWRGRFRG